MNDDIQKIGSESNVSPKKKGILRRLYDWVLHWANTPYGTPALFLISFAESSFFPIPPDVLQIALSAGKPKRSFYYATVSLIGSVLGAIFGYFVGYIVWEVVKEFFFNHVFSENAFNVVKEFYDKYDFWAIFIGALTPIPPYKIFTITAGVCEISLVILIIASIIGRGGRFYMVAALLYFFGPNIKTWIEKYFEILSVLFLIILIGSYVILTYVF